MRRPKIVLFLEIARSCGLSCDNVLAFILVAVTDNLFSWNFVNETRLTENFATPIIPLGTFHFSQLPLLRISQGKIRNLPLRLPLWHKKG